MSPPRNSCSAALQGCQTAQSTPEGLGGEKLPPDFGEATSVDDTLARMRLISFALAAALACGSSELAQEVVRTADITKRGLSASNFPRITKLADGVYAYEQIDPTKRIVTANNLIVTTSAGVLVAEGQGTVENVKRLVADIATLTPQPIKYVVVGSEHGDHIGGDSAFPESATFIVHPFSQAAIERRIGRKAETMADTRVIAMGGREIRVLFLGRAHTGVFPVNCRLSPSPSC